MAPSPLDGLLGISERTCNMSFAEEKCNPANIHSSNPRRRPIPPITPPTIHTLRDGRQLTIRNAVRHDPDRTDRILSVEDQHDDNEHLFLCKTLCKTGKYTKAFDGIQFSRQEFYDRSLIRVAVLEGGTGGKTGDGIIGFTNFWQKVRTPICKLYFVVVDPKFQRLGVSEALMADLYAVCEHNALELDVNKTNPAAIALYQKHGFVTEGESLKGTCYYMTKRWAK